jgi:hypothetical protein
LAGSIAALACLGGAAHADPLTTPALTVPLSANPNPTVINTGILGDVYVTGAVTAVAYTQTNTIAGDNKDGIDINNAQVFIQKTDGVIQFYAQAGIYAMSTLGFPQAEAVGQTDATFGALQVGFVKIVPNDNFNIMVGKLSTLIGAEYTNSFQNMNITRGQLWNQENAVNRGVQVNFASGPISASVSVNDGYYSNKYSWVSALVAYTIDPNNVLAVVAGGNTDNTGRVSGATPLLQNNQDVVNVIYTHTSGPLTLMPYFQYTRVPAMPEYGVTESGSTTGFALLGKYSFNDSFHLAARGEYIKSKNSSTNLLYGPGSKAWTFTVTPTLTLGRAYIRGEVAYIRASDFAAGSGFGAAGNKRSQTRALVETGVLF